VLKRYQSRQDSLTKLNYNTLNNIARCYNILGNIHESIEYLLLAYEYVTRSTNEENEYLTILPELGLNICNALNYIGNYT